MGFSIKLAIEYIAIFLFGLAIAYRNNYDSKKKNELVLIWRNNCYHIHHWITYSIIIASMYSFLLLDIKYIHIVAIFLVGLIAEDLFYRDIFKIREPCSKSMTLTNTNEKKDPLVALKKIDE